MEKTRSGKMLSPPSMMLRHPKDFFDGAFILLEHPISALASGWVQERELPRL